LPCAAACDGDDADAPDAASRGDGGARDAGRTPADSDGGGVPPAPAIGQPCAADADCSGGTCATRFTIARMSLPAPDGYCTAECTAHPDCPGGSACVGARFGFPGRCTIGCTSTDDCRGGYRCIPLPGGGTALDGGTAQSTVIATCQPAPETDRLEDGVVGSACAADVDCGDGRCLLSERVTGAVYPDGYCTGSCVDDADCGALGLCTPGFLGAIGVCALRCADDEECGRDGYRCRVIDGVGRCAPGPAPQGEHVAGSACASDGDCGGGAMTCKEALGDLAAPDGYCSQNCAIDEDCGAGGVCVSGIGVVTIATGLCYGACSPSQPCRDGYGCRSLTGSTSDPSGVCAPDRPDDDAGTP
jgi:hypothetical protein